MVEHESSNLSETKNMVSYIIDTTTPKTPLYETTQQAEGKKPLHLQVSPSAHLLVVPVDQLVDRLLCKQKAQDSNSCGHIPATFDPIWVAGYRRGQIKSIPHHQSPRHY